MEIIGMWLLGMCGILLTAMTALIVRMVCIEFGWVNRRN